MDANEAKVTEESEKKDKERLKRFFPAYFSQFTLPEGAREEKIRVYRACRSGKCDELSFMPTYEEKGRKLSLGDDITDPKLYSLSTYEKPKDIKRYAAMTSDLQVPYKIAIGDTDPEWGLVQRTKERGANAKERKKAGSHVDWWIYEGATPHKSFELIPDFDKYFEAYMKERDEENV